MPREDQTYSDQEIERRRDDAIRRALSTPPQPRPPPKKGKRGRPRKSDAGATGGKPSRSV